MERNDGWGSGEGRRGPEEHGGEGGARDPGGGQQRPRRGGAREREGHGAARPPRRAEEPERRERAGDEGELAELDAEVEAEQRERHLALGEAERAQGALDIVLGQHPIAAAAEAQRQELAHLAIVIYQKDARCVGGDRFRVTTH